MAILTGYMQQAAHDLGCLRASTADQDGSTGRSLSKRIDKCEVIYQAVEAAQTRLSDKELDWIFKTLVGLLVRLRVIAENDRKTRLEVWDKDKSKIDKDLAELMQYWSKIQQASIKNPAADSTRMSFASSQALRDSVRVCNILRGYLWDSLYQLSRPVPNGLLEEVTKLCDLLASASRQDKPNEEHVHSIHSRAMAANNAWVNYKRENRLEIQKRHRSARQDIANPPPTGGFSAGLHNLFNLFVERRANDASDGETV
ncbi:hypothetical protein OIV83_004213 [Microbotryomycetes sp. JL201]|nr:hypothetical protein OIV83_004213 [Microbotryomycetes sp. JL201]